MDTTLDITALDAEATGLLAAVKDGQLVLSSISDELTTLEREVDTVEAELEKIDEEFVKTAEEHQKEEAAMLAEMNEDIVQEVTEDAEDAEDADDSE